MCIELIAILDSCCEIDRIHVGSSRMISMRTDFGFDFDLCSVDCSVFL
jgi:hypothetical protein